MFIGFFWLIQSRERGIVTCEQEHGYERYFIADNEKAATADGTMTPA
jgi:hypothetical protein